MLAPMPSPEDLHLDFRFVKETDADEHRVPAKVLAATMEHAQRALHLIGMSVEGMEVRQRARISTEIEERYVLTFEPPREGSYLQTARLEGTGAYVDLFGLGGASTHREDALDHFKRIGAFIADGQPERVREVLPDRNLRLRVLDEFADFLPKNGEGWALELANGTGSFARFTYGGLQAVRAFVRNQLEPEDRSALAVAAGRVIRLDVERRTFAFRLVQDNRVLSCSYADEAEPLLVDNLRDLVRVSGEAVRGDDGQIEQIVNVFDIEDLDLTPFVLEEVSLSDGVVLRFAETPRTFEVTLDPSGELLLLEDGVFGTNLAATSRQELYEMLLDEVELLWHEYALAEDAELTEGARRLKQTVRTHLMPTQHDAS